MDEWTKIVIADCTSQEAAKFDYLKRYVTYGNNKNINRYLANVLTL